MNKRIKKVIVIALTVSALSTIGPTVNLMTTKAYASTSETQLKSIYLSEGDIDFSSSTYSYTIDVSSSVDEIRITAKPKDEDSTVEIDGTEVDEEDNYRDTVSLDKGKNTIKIKVTDDDGDKRTYTLTIYRGIHTSDSNDEYLDNLKVEGTEVSLSNNKTSYDVYVKDSTDEATIKAVPEDKDYIVKIAGSTVDEYDDYEKEVELNRGKNTFEIKIKDDDNDVLRTYTLNIFRGNVSSGDTSPVINSSVKANQWVYVNGQMQYNDAFGKPLKNTWFWDSKVSKYYYLDYNGYKYTGWLYNNSHWYYLDGNGVMLTGWQYINGKWYYLDANGAMKTGWLRNYNGTWYYLNNNGTMKTGWMIDKGKYYYLNSNGSMAHDTVVSGYKLGADGAWIGR